ncbi:tetraspanning orphan receptor isoform X2 [Drosophila innubila]|uniref:tetraspanning orphan receptor isoform X2 n=1 Tax=Drosophila innubila TaxID=198719 RepID=UPI00148E4679|nr:tetraspanning orphan receptor isoform X2 [Drosophila innubila]
MFRIRVKMGPQRNHNNNNNNGGGNSNNNRINKEWTCCFGLHVHTATLMIGLWHLFLNILALSVLAVIWRNPDMMDELESGSHDFTVDLNAPALPTPLSKVDPPYAYRDHSLNYQNFDMGGLVCTCMIAITLMMIYGTIKGKPSHLLPFFCLQLFDFAITTLTAAGYLCYLHTMHRIISESHRLPWREKLLKLPQEELVLVVLVVFVCIVFLKAYCIGIVWRCYKYLTLRQQHLRSLLPCVMTDTVLHGGLGGGGFGAEERAYSTLLPNYDEAIAQYLKQAPPPSYQVAMSNYQNEDEAAAGGAQSGADAGGSTPLFVALDAVTVNAASNTDDNLDNNNDVPNNNNTVHVNANTPPMRRSEQATSSAASGSDDDNDVDVDGDGDDDDDVDADLEIIDADEDLMECKLPPPPPPYNDVNDAQVQMPSPSRLNRQVNIPGQVPGRNESQA